MAKAVVPRFQGDDSQARWFWYRAAQMYLDENIRAVGYEVDDVRGFDDVAVYYAEPNADGSLQDFYQIKFKVAAGRPFTHISLTEPGFTNAMSVSILQRLRDVQAIHAPDGTGARFYLVTPAGIDPEDPLRHVVSEVDGEIRWDRLSKGGPRSRMGKVREAWKSHLGVESAQELRRVLMPLRIKERTPMLADIRERASDRLRQAGWRPYEAGIASRYDDLPRKLVQRGDTVFTTEELREIGRREGLWLSPPLGLRLAPRTVGIRSFARGTETMSEEVEELLCLLEHFEDRWPREDHSWNDTILPRVRKFLQKLPQDRPVHLTVRGHNTIAFAAGYSLDPKAGVEVYPVQVTGERQVWQPLSGVVEEEVWTAETVKMGEGADIALAIGVTHDVVDDAVRYVRDNVQQVGLVIALRVLPAPSFSSIRDGTHASRLAQRAVAAARSAKDRQRGAVTHLLAAAPAGFMFFLGQHARVLGRCRLYEHDFSETRQLAYEASADFSPEPT